MIYNIKHDRPLCEAEYKHTLYSMYHGAFVALGKPNTYNLSNLFFNGRWQSADLLTILSQATNKCMDAIECIISL